MKQVILIYPQPVVLKNYFAEKISYSTPPLGLGYLASAIRNKGFSVSIIDVGPERLSIKDILNEIETQQAKVIGISSFISNYGNGIKIAKQIKEQFPDIKIIMGGPHASFIPEEVLNSGYIDVVSMFEGEETVPLLVDAFINKKPIDDILGICYTKDGKFTSTPPRPLIEDINTIDSPAWDLFKMDRYNFPGSILTGRGCPYKCIFCAASVISGARYRMRSAKNVVDEIEFLNKKYNITYFVFIDDTFTAEERHCVEICREIRSRNLKIKWAAETRANTVNDFVVSEMVKAGCIHAQVGAESGDNKILKTIGKNITVQTIDKAVKTLLAHGVLVTCSFIIGNPEDTKETIDKTIKLALKHKKSSINDSASSTFSLLTPLPGTPVYMNKEKLGIQLTTGNWDNFTFYDPIIETKYLNKRELQNHYARAWMSYNSGVTVE